MKTKLDLVLIEKRLTKSQKEAQAIIMAGRILVDDKVIDKPGTLVSEKAKITIIESFPYVSRGALKLEKAFQEFELDFKDKIVCDIGSSTGGFSDFALQHGAKKVFAVDVGRGQLDQKIREDNRVVVMEKTDFRDVKNLPEKIDYYLCDVSFISIKRILPHIKELIDSEGDMSLRAKRSNLTKNRSPRCFTPRDYKAQTVAPITSQFECYSFVIPTDLPAQSEMKEGAEESKKRPRSLDFARDDTIGVIALIKPQFEVEEKEVSRGKGVIRDEKIRDKIVTDIINFAESLGFEVKGLVESPIRGAKGNKEYLVYFRTYLT